MQTVYKREMFVNPRREMDHGAAMFAASTHDRGKVLVQKGALPNPATTNAPMKNDGRAPVAENASP
jgi:hypothetical protein